MSVGANIVDPSDEFFRAGWRTLVTPEGVQLNVELAGRGERLGAVLIDLFFMLLCVSMIWGILLYFLYLVDFRVENVGGWLVALVTVSSFAVRGFYFIFFELRWQGRTPGKKLLGLRVIDRGGGPLLAKAIFARNLTRELELFIPLTVMMAANYTHGIGKVESLLSLGWLSIFVLMPLLNKNRLRVGDMIAGTWVVETPAPVLMPDLTETLHRRQRARARSVRKDVSVEEKASFTAEQLDVYGIYELQTLEDVLRRGGATTNKTYSEICTRIKKKIGWEQVILGQSPKEFLEAYYSALRAHLEGKLVFGDRREDKFHESRKKHAKPSN